MTLCEYKFNLWNIISLNWHCCLKRIQRMMLILYHTRKQNLGTKDVPEISGYDSMFSGQRKLMGMLDLI